MINYRTAIPSNQQTPFYHISERNQQFITKHPYLFVTCALVIICLDSEPLQDYGICFGRSILVFRSHSRPTSCAAHEVVDQVGLTEAQLTNLCRPDISSHHSRYGTGRRCAFLFCNCLLTQEFCLSIAKTMYLCRIFWMLIGNRASFRKRISFTLWFKGHTYNF